MSGLRFKHHVRVTSETYVRLTLGSSIINLAKGIKNLRTNYVSKIGLNYVTKIK